MSSNLLSYAGWAILPDLVTNWTQTILYAVFIRAGDPRPQRGTPRFVAHRQRIYVAVILTYLIYCLYEAHWEIRQASDHYELLGVSTTVDDRALQSRFRRLTLLYHPDKVNPSPSARPAVEAYYAALLNARDTLLDPTKRYAYDRFGPQMAQWHGATVRDFVTTGLRAMAPYYAAWAAGLVALAYLGMLNWGTYWRWLAFAAMAAFELRMLTRADAALLPPAWRAPPALAPWLPRAYLPFQTLRFAHKAVVATFVALSRLGPLLDAVQGAGPVAAGAGSEDAQLQRITQGVEQLVGLGGREAAVQLAREALPFSPENGVPASDAAARGRDSDFKGFKHDLKQWLLKNAVRGDREVQEAMRRQIERERVSSDT